MQQVVFCRHLLSTVEQSGLKMVQSLQREHRLYRGFFVTIQIDFFLKKHLISLNTKPSAKPSDRPKA